jgi:hypothetical protein
LIAPEGLHGSAQGFHPISANLIKASAGRMYFVPEGQHEAGHEVPGLQFGHLQKVLSGNLRPEGTGGLSPGFQAWEPTTQSDAP